MQVKITGVKVDEKALENAVSQILDGIADNVEKEIKLNVTDREMMGYIINDRGNLYRSISSDKSNSVRKIVHIAVPYAEGLEWGKNPHETDYNEILSWVNRKAGITDYDAAKEFTIYVMRKMEWEGQNPRRFVSDAIDRTKQKCEK